MTSGEGSTRAAIQWMSLMRVPHLVIPPDSHALLTPQHKDVFTPFTLAIPDASTVLIQVLVTHSCLNNLYN